MRLDHELSHPPTGRESQKVDLIVTENPEEPDDILDDELRLIRGRPQVPAASPAPAQVKNHHVTILRNREQPWHQITVVPAAPGGTPARPQPSPHSSGALSQPEQAVTADDRWYVPHDDKNRFTLDQNGMPPLHLVSYERGGEAVLRLCEDSTGLLVGPTDRRLFDLGIYSYNAVGEAHHAGACRSSDFSPGAGVRFVREPDNPYDPNAVAILAHEPRARVAAYVSKGHAKRLARLLDSGAEIAVVAVRETAPGRPCQQISVVGASPEVLAHLLSPRAAQLPPPVHLQ